MPLIRSNIMNNMIHLKMLTIFGLINFDFYFVKNYQGFYLTVMCGFLVLITSFVEILLHQFLFICFFQIWREKEYAIACWVTKKKEKQS